MSTNIAPHSFLATAYRHPLATAATMPYSRDPPYLPATQPLSAILFWLPLSFLFSFGFAQLFKWSHHRGYRPQVVVATNYLVLAACLGLVLLWRGQSPLHFPALGHGLMTGTSFLVSMTALTTALGRTTVAPVLTAFRLSIVVPVAVGVWLWGESLSPAQLAGIPLALLALALMSRSGTAQRSTGRTLVPALIVVVFLTQGISHLFLGGVHHLGLDPFRMPVIFFTALTGGTLGAAVFFLQGQRPRRAELGMGAAIGLYNLGALNVILIVLSQVPMSVFFPAQGCAVVLLDNIFAHFVWREPLDLVAVVGAGLGALALVLVL